MRALWKRERQHEFAASLRNAKIAWAYDGGPAEKSASVLRQAEGLVHASPNALKLDPWHALHRAQKNTLFRERSNTRYQMRGIPKWLSTTYARNLTLFSSPGIRRRASKISGPIGLMGSSCKFMCTRRSTTVRSSVTILTSRPNVSWKLAKGARAMRKANRISLKTCYIRTQTHQVLPGTE